MGTAPARARRAAALTRTRAIVGGTSIGTFLAILAVVGIHDRSKSSSTVRTGNDRSTTNLDPGLVGPNVDQAPFGNRFGGSQSDAGSGTVSPFSRGFSGGGFSATPGAAGTSPSTRSHGS